MVRGELQRIDTQVVPEKQPRPFSWRSSVVYEAHPGGFEKNPQGRKFLHEMTYRLKKNYFEDLGIDAIWIPPIYPSAGFDQGYDVSDYTKVADEFGGMEAFDEFVTEAHNRGIRVIMDLVANHTATNHPWYKEASSSRDNPKHDWYLFHEAKPDGTAPSATRNAFHQPGWQYNEVTQEYVWSSFSPEGQRDLNWENPEVREAMMGVIDFWMNKHSVDGFRGDALPFMSKDMVFYNPHSIVSDNAAILNGPHTVDYIGEIAARIGQKGVLIPEVSINDALAAVEKVHGKQIFTTQEEVDMVLDAIAPFYHLSGSEIAPVYFIPYYADWNNATNVKMLYDRVFEKLPKGAIPAFLISDHDENARVFSRLNPERARQAKIIQFTMPGVSIMYYGDEIGMQNQEGSVNGRRDVLGRQRGRNSMEWKKVEEQKDDPQSELAFTKKLVEIKHSYPAISEGKYQPLDIGENIYGYMWVNGDEKILVLNNFSNMDIIGISLGEKGEQGLQLVTSKMDRKEEVRDVSNLSLRANESIVIRV